MFDLLLAESDFLLSFIVSPFPDLQFFTFSANLRDYKVELKFSAFGEIFTSIKVREEPSKYLYKTWVSLLFLKGMCFYF